MINEQAEEYIKPTYRIKNVDVRDLLFNFDFRKCNKDILVYRFPIHKYKGKTLIYGEFSTFDDDANILHINAFDSNGNTYDYNKTKYGKSKLIENVNKKIREELNKLIKGGIVIDE